MGSTSTKVQPLSSSTSRNTEISMLISLPQELKNRDRNLNQTAIADQ
ncbi:hypothetical protein AM1_1033 [Acaryochloris marina MBIC11017]|uniref:Uncharacterized protein n=1 Tax=Acaryochloris marina (strain MBIC 11017) TaxID=329726 RepID=B0C0U9_ACAM1|nr:hypothetical protein AM1_1033 [Acaryochloris marina MBIC11017]